MSGTSLRRPARSIPILGSLRRTARLTWVEILKLLWAKLFPTTIIITLIATAGLALAGKYITQGVSSSVRFSNYSLWVASSSLGLRVGMVLLVAIGAAALSSEATGRTLNTMLTRPMRRLEFVAAKILALVFATVVVVAAAALAAYIVGGTVQPRWNTRRTIVSSIGQETVEEPPRSFPSYGDVVDPTFPDTVIATQAEVMGSMLYGFLLLVVPVLAGVSLGFMLGTVLNSSGLAIGLSVGLFVSLEGSKFFSMFEENIGRYTYNYPINRIYTLMGEAGKGGVPVWDDAVRGVGVAAIYVAACLLVSVVVFCRRDVTL